MAEQWQQWMPLDINEFRGSPSVQAMHPTARSGYFYLLMTQWQKEDCTLPNDPIELAIESGLGDELWAQFGPVIVRKFAVMENGTLRNEVCFEKWNRAKHVFESRRQAAQKTNSTRSPHGHRTVTARRADTRTVTGTVTGTGTRTGEGELAAPPPTPPEPPAPPRRPSAGANGEFMLAQELGSEIKLAMRAGDIALVAQVIANEADEHGGPLKAKNFIRDKAIAAQTRGQPVTVFWLQDRKFAFGEIDKYEAYMRQGD